ncbi:MAG: heavy-metal-associated domain-containing protein [Halanaerobium sp.]|nr:heavy-metal-associated domain-containing protein [Halanaerobium sp.]
MKKATLYLEDLSCPDCASKIEALLNRNDGVRDARVHFTTGKAKVEYDQEQVGIEDLKKIVAATGYRVERVS